MLGFLTWFWIVYLTIGFGIMIDALAEMFRESNYTMLVKIIAAIICIFSWPLVFIVT